jgi:hypothetical protein
VIWCDVCEVCRKWVGFVVYVHCGVGDREMEAVVPYRESMCRYSAHEYCIWDIHSATSVIAIQLQSSVSLTATIYTTAHFAVILNVGFLFSKKLHIVTLAHSASIRFLMDK